MPEHPLYHPPLEQRRHNLANVKTNTCTPNSLMILVILILTSLPYSSMSLPNGDPAPGRSPGPPKLNPNPEDVGLSLDYDSTTEQSVVSTVSDVAVDDDACAFARVPSDSDSIVTLSEDDSDVNLTVTHAAFETGELVRGVLYDVHLIFEEMDLRDFVLHSTVDGFVRGNFTPTTFMEHPCPDQPYFLPKFEKRTHKERPSYTTDRKSYLNPNFSDRTKYESDITDQSVKSYNKRASYTKDRKSYTDDRKSYTDDRRSYTNSRIGYLSDLLDDEFRTKSDSVYFRPRFRGERSARGRSVRSRRRFLPVKVLAGPLGDRAGVVLQWTMSDAVHLDKEESSVVFRLRYRKTTSATIYQVFFTKLLRLECAIRVRGGRSIRVHSGQTGHAHNCRLLLPAPTPHSALLAELHKLNVPCSTGFLRFAPNTPTLCGKLEQIPTPNRHYIYQEGTKNPTLELHGRPTFAAIFRQVDHCHDVLLTARNGSFEVGPIYKLLCSYRIHLPYGNRVALRLQMGTGSMSDRENDYSNIIHEEAHALCRGMELSLQDGDSMWRHCSQPGDPLRNVQIVSEGNYVRLNISVNTKKNTSAMWLKVWWMDKAVDAVVGHCDYGWVVSGEFCISAMREGKRAWRQAEAECVRLGGHLASVLSDRQQQTMDQLLMNSPGAGIDDVYWIGATDAVHEGEFRWSDGLPFSFAHWFPGWRKHSSQPNDDGTSGQDCVEARREFPPRPPPAEPTFMWNDRGCREHNYFVCERAGSSDPYPPSKTQCNETIVLSHSHPHATVSSPGFPRPYPDDVECVSEVRAPTSHTLRLHFEELLTEHEPHCTYDFLEIIEVGADNTTDHDQGWVHDHHESYSDNEVWEETETLLPESDSVGAGWAREHDSRTRRLCGDWGGKLKLLRYQSRTDALRIRFRSDHSRHFAGFRAKITLTDSQSCMDAKQVLFNGHCYLYSGYPRASWNTAKQVCEGLNMYLTSVHSAEEERFIVSSVRQSSDYSAGSVYWLGGRLTKSSGDEFAWIDGSAFDYQGWPPYNETEVIDEACLGVQWKTSPIPSQPSGFYWTLLKCSTTGGYVCKRRLNPEHTVKNQTVEESSGILTSPNHPNMYDNNIDYWVHVVGPEDTRLVFVFDTIDLEYQKDCLYDFVELRDVRNMKSSRYCGSVGETRWVASSNKAVLHFHSDYNVQGAGFSISWQAVELPGCPSQIFTSKEGVLQSPNYPHFLLPNLDCTIDILAPAGKRIFLNISYYDFGYGIFENGVPINVPGAIPDDYFIEVQVDLQSTPIRPFIDPHILTSGMFVSQSDILRLRFKTGENVTGRGFLAHFDTVNFINISHVVYLGNARAGRLAAPNWPARGPSRSVLTTRLLAPHNHTLTLVVPKAALSLPHEPCPDGVPWLQVRDSYSDYNGTEWTLCTVTRPQRKLEPNAPLLINSYLYSLTVTQHVGEQGGSMDVSVIVNKDQNYHSKMLLLSDETSLESCYPDPCVHGGRCTTNETKTFCQCNGLYTGVFCLVRACERSPCAYGTCIEEANSAGDGWSCVCARGYRGRLCAERVRPCAGTPCYSRGACLERDGTFLCQCNPSWKGKRCEIPNPTPNIIGLGQRMLHEPFWLGLITVFVVLGMIGLIWCAKRHFPEKIEKLLAEEADRCARHASGAGSQYNSMKDFRTGTPSPRKKRNNSTPTKKNLAEKQQILQQLVSPAPANEHSKKLTMGELIQMSEKRTLSTVESAPAYLDYGSENKETSFASEASSPSTSPSMRHISDPKLEKKVTFARLLNRVSAEMSSSSEVDMVNTITIPMAVIADRGGLRAKASSTPPSPGVEIRSPHSTSSNQGSDSMSSLDLTLANAALKKYSRTPKISSADSILAMFRNFSSSSAAMVSRASSGGVSISSTPSASSPQDDTVDGDDISLASSHIPSLAPDSPITRPHNTIEIQVLDPLSGHKSSGLGSNLLHPPSILLEVPSGINKCLSPIRELPTPLPTPMPTPLPSPRLPRAVIEPQASALTAPPGILPSEEELNEIKRETRPERPPLTLRLKLRQPLLSASSISVTSETPTPSTQVTESRSPSLTQSADSERSASPAGAAAAGILPILCVPLLTVSRASPSSPGSPPPRRDPPHLDLAPPPLITVTYNASEESDEPLSPRPPPPMCSTNMCYLSPFSMAGRGERAPSESNLSSSGYSSMASPGPSRCGSSNPLCPSEMEDPGSGGGGCFPRRRPLTKTSSGPAGGGAGGGDAPPRRRGRSDSETLSDDPLLESNDEGIGTDERVDDLPTSAKAMELALKETLEVPTICSPSGVTKCSIVKCASVERGLEERALLRPPPLPALATLGVELSPVSSRSESPLSERAGLGRFSPQFYGRQLPFTDSDGLYDFPSSECVKGGSARGAPSAKKTGRRRDRRQPRPASHDASTPGKASLPHMPHSMHNLLEVPGRCEAARGGRKGGRRRSRSQAPAPASSSSSEDSVSNASVASVASARELRLPDLEMQDTATKISSSLDLTEDSRKPTKISKLRTISNQIRFLRRLERSLKIKESYPALSDDEGDESSSVTSPLLQGRKELNRIPTLPTHAISAPLLSNVRPKITRQRRYDRSLISEDTRTLNSMIGQDNSD